VISVRVSSLERSYIKYTRLPSAVYQYVINQVVSLPIRRVSGVLFIQLLDMELYFGAMQLIAVRFSDFRRG